MKHYHVLGKLPKNIIDEFANEVLNLKTVGKPYQWIFLNKKLEKLFLDLFVNIPLKIQFNPSKNTNVQKIFYSEPGYGFRIHKDGLRCKSALNIAISSNITDWVRWYDDNEIKKMTVTVERENSVTWGLSRDTNLRDYENIPFIDELKVEDGTVYLLDVDSYHSFKCNGPNPRIVLQTKFENFPSLDNLCKNITPDIFKILKNV